MLDQITAPSDIRRALLRNGYSPIPVNGKKPTMDEWSKKLETNNSEIDLWSSTWPYARNTGILTKFTPAIDIDVMVPGAAEAIEHLARETFGENGNILTHQVRAGAQARSASPHRRAVQKNRAAIHCARWQRAEN
jgi:hypothetical protein